ncbi:MAG: ATP-binding protein, partial [Candidatus Binatia bacterium]
MRLTKDGRAIPVLSTLSAVRNRKSELVMISAAFRDITELTAARESLRDEARRKDEFMAMVSHELRNPLAPLRTALEIAREPSSPPETVAQSHDVMARQLSRVTSIVDQLLDASRVATGRLVLRGGLVDLDELVRVTIADYRQTLEAAGLTVGVDSPGRPIWIEGDGNRLGQVLANALDNAVKFTERGGSVTITLGLAKEGSRDAAVLSVLDDGDGMEPDAVERLFARDTPATFDSVHRRGGLGLGLWLAKSLVKAHEGSVAAKSAGKGQGFELVVRLPVWSRAPQEHPSARREGAVEASTTPKRVLLVDDDPDGLEMMRILLRLDGHEVDVALDGIEALRKARDFRPDLVLCDIGLPGQLDGYGVARALRADPATRDLRLIAVTGSGRDEDRRRALDA